MKYLLDTNVISEIIRKRPNKHVLSWLSSIDINKFALSVITIGEIRKGIERLDDAKKKRELTDWLENAVLDTFSDRIIPIDAAVADKWGYLCANRTLPAIDALIAASALVHDLKLVTRNTKDFDVILGLELVNPFES